MAEYVKDAILCSPHQWVQALPLKKGEGICMHCGVRAPLRELHKAPRCRYQIYAWRSGFTDAETGMHCGVDPQKHALWSWLL